MRYPSALIYVFVALNPLVGQPISPGHRAGITTGLQNFAFPRSPRHAFYRPAGKRLRRRLLRNSTQILKWVKGMNLWKVLTLKIEVGILSNCYKLDKFRFTTEIGRTWVTDIGCREWVGETKRISRWGKHDWRINWWLDKSVDMKGRGS